MKVTPGENFGGTLAIGEYERIVRRAIQFHSRHVPHIFQGFADRSVHLRYTTQAVGVLDPATIDVRLPDLALPEKLRQAFGDFDLSLVRSGLVNRSEERRVGTECRSWGPAAVSRKESSAPASAPAR